MTSSFNDETVLISIGELQENKEIEPAIEVLSGPAIGRQIVLPEGESVWGRGKDIDVILEDESISRHQFKIIVQEKSVTIQDLKSKNGTYVNGVRIQEYRLQPNDKIQISPTTLLRFSYVDFIDTDVHKRIYEMALYDPVTQAHTKRYFLDRLKHEFTHSKRHNQPLSLIMFDLDHFKCVNDDYGHPAGDFVLQQVSEMTKTLIREEDIFARYGGEEFVIIMRNCDEMNAIKLAERIRQKIEIAIFLYQAKRMKITVSLGVACYYDQNVKSSDELVSIADQCLYFSKAQGRNRVSFQALLI